MPLIEARTHRVRTVRQSRWLEPNRDTMVPYVRFIGDTPDYVANQLIERTLAKGREFVVRPTEQAAESRAAGPPSTAGAPRRGTSARSTGGPA